MNVKQLIDKLESTSNKRIEIFTPNPNMDWEINVEHWIEQVKTINNQCVIYAEYWEPLESEPIDVEGLLLILSQVEPMAEITIHIPDGEELYIKDIENTYALKIYADYPYDYY